MLAPHFRRWRPHFSLKLLLVGLAALCALAAWLAAEYRLCKTQQRLIAELSDRGIVKFVYSIPSWPMRWINVAASEKPLELEFNESVALDEHVARAVGQLKSLGKLSLKGTRIDTALQEALKRLSNLKGLELVGCSVENDDWAFLRSLNQLEFVDFSQGQITEQCLHNLQFAKRLRAINVTDSRAASWNLSSFSKLPSLLGVFLEGTSITDAQLETLGPIPSLRHLDLSRTHVTTAGIESLLRRQPVTRLILAETDIDDAVFRVIRASTPLNMLNVNGCNVCDEGLMQLEGHPSLSWLLAARTNITDKSLRLFDSCPQLGQFEANATAVSNSAAAAVEDRYKSRDVRVMPGIIYDNSSSSPATTTITP